MIQCVRRWHLSETPGPQMVMEILLDLQQGQRAMREEIREQFNRLEARMDRVEARQGAVEALLRQHTRRLDTVTFDLANVRRDVAALRLAVQDYHGAMVGHGMHISELDERVRRIEEHLGLSPI